MFEPETEFGTAEEYLMEIADESQEAAAQAEATNVGDTSLAALHRSIEEIGHLYRRTAPLPIFRRTMSLRNRVLDLLEGHQHVNQTRELYAAASKVCALLAWMSGDFEQHGAALAQGDAAWVFAEQADQPAVRALARISQAKERAVTGIGEVLALPSSHRLGTLSQRLDRAQRLLTAPGWQGSRPTRELHTQISDFRVDTAAGGLSA